MLEGPVTKIRGVQELLPFVSSFISSFGGRAGPNASRDAAGGVHCLGGDLVVFAGDNFGTHLGSVFVRFLPTAHSVGTAPACVPYRVRPTELQCSLVVSADTAGDAGLGCRHAWNQVLHGIHSVLIRNWVDTGLESFSNQEFRSVSAQSVIPEVIS